MCLPAGDISLCHKVGGKCSDSELNKDNAKKRCRHFNEIKCDQCNQHCKWHISKSTAIENKDGETVEEEVPWGKCVAKS